MKLQAAELPAEASDEIQRGLQLALRASSPSADTFERAIGGGASISTGVPHAVYVITPEDVTDGDFLDRAHQVSLRTFVIEPDGDAPSVAAEVRVEPHGNVRGFSQLLRGSYVSRLWRAIAVASELPDDDSAEIRLLEAPALYFAALWLHSEIDRLIPFQERSQNLEPFVVYSPKEVRDALAKQRALTTGGGLPPRHAVEGGSSTRKP